MSNTSVLTGLDLEGNSITGVGAFDCSTLFGGLGARGGATGGNNDFNVQANRRSGFPRLLMQPGAVDQPSNNFYHLMNFEYLKTNGTGNVTQFAVPYYLANENNRRIYMRGWYNTTWGGWQEILAKNTAGRTVIDGTDDNTTALQTTTFRVRDVLNVSASAAKPWVSSGHKSIQVGTACGIFANSTLGTFYFIGNAYYDGTWKGGSANSGAMLMVAGSGFLGFSGNPTTLLDQAFTPIEYMRINNADGAVLIGKTTTDGVSKLQVVGSINATTNYCVNGTQVLGVRDTGWTAAAGTVVANKAAYAPNIIPAAAASPTKDEFDAAVTALNLANGRIKALEAALRTHGIID